MLIFLSRSVLYNSIDASIFMLCSKGPFYDILAHRYLNKFEMLKTTTSDQQWFKTSEQKSLCTHTQIQEIYSKIEDIVKSILMSIVCLSSAVLWF